MMMNFDEIVVKESPGLCRCCLSEGCYKDLGTEYTWMNETEVYADMLLECFDISISQHNDGPNGPNRLICEVCITRLRDACNFKKQVLSSEKKFVDMIGRGEFRPKVLIYQTQMKPEPTIEETPNDEGEVEYLEEDMDFGDDELLKPEDIVTEQAPVSEDITVATLPVKGKRGRPRKNPPVAKTEKKVKVAKLDDKPRTSKAVTKDTAKGGRKKVGGRSYRQYSDELLQKVLNDIRLKKISAREAQKRYGIHRNSLALKLRSDEIGPSRNPGRQTVLSKQEENVICALMIALANNGFPMNKLEMRLMVKGYLSRIGRTVPTFKDNMPGEQWSKSFLSRHVELGTKMSRSTSRCRSGFNRAIVNEFLDNLEDELHGISPETFWH